MLPSTTDGFSTRSSLFTSGSTTGSRAHTQARPNARLSRLLVASHAAMRPRMRIDVSRGTRS